MSLKYIHLKSSDTQRNDRGFSLIELAIIMMIVGLILASIATALRVHSVNQKYASSKVNAQNAKFSINQFRSDFGRYPCPANPNIAPNAPSFGLEDCIWARAQGLTGVRDTDVDADANDDPILIGHLPLSANANSDGNPFSGAEIVQLSTFVEFDRFREKGKSIKDPWNIGFTYAVTDSLTNVNTFDPDYGVIKITDETDTDTSGISENAHYVIISNGANAGECVAWDFDSVMINRGLDPLDATDLATYTSSAQTFEEENCDGDGEFKQALRSDINTNDFYDDFLQFDRYESSTFWAPTNETNSDDLYMVKAGKLAIGSNYRNVTAVDTDATDSPLADELEILKLDVDGNIITDQMVASDYMCDDATLNGSTCFNPSTMQNLECPNPAEYLRGVSVVGGVLTPNCEPLQFQNLANESCGAQYLNGLYTDGRLVCQSAP